MGSEQPGLIVLLGSGETQPSSSRTHEYVAQKLPLKPRVVILETPAGFELNSDRVAGRIKTFLERRLQNYLPQIEVIPARKRGTEFSPNNEEIVAPIYSADEILLGPGSPTYNTRQLQESLALDIIRSRHRLGAALFLSSAATISFSAYAIPVYEIYKVGEDPYWNKGLNFLADYGLNVVIVPHWNNNDGGEELDTSRCYIGKPRFELLMGQLPEGLTILGIDDHTSLVIDFELGCCLVSGNDTVTIQMDGVRKVYRTGEEFPLSLLGQYQSPNHGSGIRPEVWQKAQEIAAAARQEDMMEEVPDENIQELLAARQQARVQRKWEEADRLRDQIVSMGWQVMDTPEGSRVVRLQS